MNSLPSVDTLLSSGCIHSSSPSPPPSHSHLLLPGVDFTPASGFELDGVSHFEAWGTGEIVREYLLYNDYYNVEGLAANKWTNQTFAVRNNQ